jgi:hypothetical protein
MKSIPEIAEDLRTHINTDNDAKRLIVEHILPLIGMNFASLEATLGAGDRIDDLESSFKSAHIEISNAVTTLREIRDDSYVGSRERIEALATSIDSTINAYLTP